MGPMKREAIVALLIEKMREHGSWCGETHVQKAVYFLQDMLKLDTGFDFILYKHGPFSFDLRDELTAMRADGFVDLEFQGPSYGPSLAAGKNAVLLKRLFRKTLERQGPKIDFLACKFGDKNVIELECLASALYVTGAAEGEPSIQDRAAELTALKPHISPEDAIHNVETVDAWSVEVESESLAESGRD